MSTESSKRIVPNHSECLVCGKALDCSNETFNDCTIWRSYGNYGSSEFDPMSGELTCEAVICDECLNKKSKVVRVVKRTKTQEVVVGDQTFVEWKDRLKHEL